MAWLGKVSLGGFPDLAGAVTKLSESVKNIEKNFDTALGLDGKPDTSSPPGEDSGIWPSASERKALFDPVMAFMGHRGDDSASEALEKAESSEHASSAKEQDDIPTEGSLVSTSEVIAPAENENKDSESGGKEDRSHSEDIISNVSVVSDEKKELAEAGSPQAESVVSHAENTEPVDSVVPSVLKDYAEDGIDVEPHLEEPKAVSSDGVEQHKTSITSILEETQHVNDPRENNDKEVIDAEHLPNKHLPNKGSPKHADTLDNRQPHLETESSDAVPLSSPKKEGSIELSNNHIPDSLNSERDLAIPLVSISQDTHETSELVEVVSQGKEFETTCAGKSPGTKMVQPISAESDNGIERLKKEMKQMEAALQGAARQAQAKADEIANLMNENEQLKLTIEDLKRKSHESEIDTLREEYHQRVASLERKVYALTRERDTLRREQNKKSDAAALLKEKDEIISQVMAEGEELSKKQATQEATIRKLRAQIREAEEEKQRLNSKLQAEETKVETIKRDKAATEKLLQETIERNQAELAAQKEFYTTALNAAKEAEALAEARANSEARIELEGRLKEASEREAMLVQALEELRQTLSRTEQQAVFREDMLRRDIDDLQKRYQASELRYNELITQVPESTRPLLRQIEAMQETTARRAEAWAGVERALNSRLQEAEAKAAGAEERERSINERLSQTLSRITVLETQITCLRTEQTQLSRSLEKERQRAAENRQEYLAAKEEAATQEGRAKQLEEEIKEIRIKYKQELHEEAARRELLEKELERERTARSELEKSSRETSLTVDQGLTIKLGGPHTENGNAPSRAASAGSLRSMEESLYLQASLDSSDSFFSERRAPVETTMSPYFLKSMTPSAFEAALRQKDGEIASYISRLASLESIRDSLAEELVKMTAQCEKLRAEAALLPGIRAELEALRRRHSSALELMGERDEELEELRADIIDLKEMYREQIDLLVNKIQMLGSSVGAV